MIIGGGITGLSVAHYLQKLKKEQATDMRIILIEQSDHLGGKMNTIQHGEFLMETGADSIVARHESVMSLLHDLHLQDEIVYNATGKSYIYTDHTLHPVPEDTIFGIPTSVESLFSSTLISEAGKNDALKDLDTKNEHFTSESSVGAFLENFLGKELVEKQISPILSGVYSGKLDELTLSSTLPYLLDYKNKYGSLIKGLSEHTSKFQMNAKKFISFKKGLSTLIDRLEAELADISILKGVKATAIHKNNAKYEISCLNDETITADDVVVATPHQVAQKLLNNEQLDDDFNRLKHASLMSIYLGFDIPDDRLPADGTGFIASQNSDLACDACTWTSRKWAHTSKKQRLLVRLFYKSSNSAYQTLQNMNDAERTVIALADVEKSLGITSEPIAVQVTNWQDLMPNYHLEHSQTVKALEGKLDTMFPRVRLAGASYYGVGIAACIKNGKEIAEGIAKITQIKRRAYE